MTEQCSQEQFEELHRALDKARRGSNIVKVDRAAFAALLMDHAELHAQISTLTKG